MPYLFVGLGNPGEKYENTRHNAGRQALSFFAKEQKFPKWRKEKVARGLLSDADFADDDVTLLLPETFMNRSGESLKKLVRNQKEAESVVVLHDEIDMPIGEMEISFGKGSGGHKGVQSIIDAFGTKNFIRIRIGVSPTNWFGNIKKPQGKNAVLSFVLESFKKREEEKLGELFTNLSKVLEVIVKEGYKKAMNDFNGE